MVKAVLKWILRIASWLLAVIGIIAIVGAIDGNRSFVDVMKLEAKQEQQLEDDKTNDDTSNEDDTTSEDETQPGTEDEGQDAIQTTTAKLNLNKNIIYI